MKTVVFSGTTEGRELCRFLSRHSIETLACVATPYGAKVMDPMPYVTVSVGRKDINKIKDAIDGCDFVVDATHPYATEITKNIKSACVDCGVKYLRLLRNTQKSSGIRVKNAKEAAGLLCNTEGMIFVSTGSKEADAFKSLKERVVIRVLDTEFARQKCGSLGFRKIIYGMGPFSFEENLRDFSGCRYLVTKESGHEGGFPEKQKAAEKLGITVIAIACPAESGFGIGQIENMVLEGKINENRRTC